MLAFPGDIRELSELANLRVGDPGATVVYVDVGSATSALPERPQKSGQQANEIHLASCHDFCIEVEIGKMNRVQVLDELSTRSIWLNMASAWQNADTDAEHCLFKQNLQKHHGTAPIQPDDTKLVEGR